MTPKIRLKHRAVEGILSSIVGGCIVGALAHWWLALVGVAVGIALFIEEKADLEEEQG